jgi:hypothetical protein
LGNGDDLPVELLHRMAMDIAGQCGHTLLKAHRLAWGWTVTQAVDAFHQMCHGEKIKPRGLVAQSWMDWEAGSRPNWDYQDLLSRLFHTSPVHLGWAADYTPADPPAARRVLAGAAAVSLAGGTPGVREQLIATDVRHGRTLLHLPPDTRDFTGRTEQVGEVTRLIAAAAAYSGTALPIVCLSGQAWIGKTTLAIHVAHRAGGEFPDGQLYANLRGADARGQDPADVLAGFLRELGVEGTDIPEGLDERARMYRAQLARVPASLEGLLVRDASGRREQTAGSAESWRSGDPGIVRPQLSRTGRDGAACLPHAGPARR